MRSVIEAGRRRRMPSSLRQGCTADCFRGMLCHWHRLGGGFLVAADWRPGGLVVGGKWMWMRIGWLYKCGLASCFVGIIYLVRESNYLQILYHHSSQANIYQLGRPVSKNYYTIIAVTTTYKHQTPPPPPPTPTTMSNQPTHTLQRQTSSPSPTPSERSTSPAAASRNSEGIIKRRSSDNKGQGTFMQCGRHSNSWLFNDISLKETAKGLLFGSGSGSGRKESS